LHYGIRLAAPKIMAVFQLMAISFWA